MEPQEDALREHLQNVIEGIDSVPSFIAWFDSITWVIRPPYIRALPVLIGLVGARIGVYRRDGATDAELRASLAYAVAAADQCTSLPADPFAGREYVNTARIVTVSGERE